MTNGANGRVSFDSTSTGNTIEFFNRNSSTYPTEIGSQSFDLVNISDQRDMALSVARLNAKQEYDRIMEVVSVLQKQAQAIKTRLDISELVHHAVYNFVPVPGKLYWLVRDTKKNEVRLSMLGPADWSAGAPDNYEYMYRVTMLGDSTWDECK